MSNSIKRITRSIVIAVFCGMLATPVAFGSGDGGGGGGSGGGGGGESAGGGGGGVKAAAVLAAAVKVQINGTFRRKLTIWERKCSMKMLYATVAYMPVWN